MTNAREDKDLQPGANFFLDRARFEQAIADLLSAYSSAHPQAPALGLRLFRRIGGTRTAPEYLVEAASTAASVPVQDDPACQRDLHALRERMSALLNALAERHRNFSPAGLTADYVDHPGRGREYLVELAARL